MGVDFWRADAFDLEDSLNLEIWANSPKLQFEVQSREDALRTLVGAQQAMLPSEVLAQVGPTLPWVPDLVGKQWRVETSILIIGSAYAGFIKEFSGRKACMDLKDYVASVMRPPREFQQLFLRDVVSGDNNYYGRVQALVQAVIGSAQNLALFDLCRASFVKRDSDGDKSNDAIVRRAPQYLRYVQHCREQLATGGVETSGGEPK